MNIQKLKLRGALVAVAIGFTGGFIEKRRKTPKTREIGN